MDQLRAFFKANPQVLVLVIITLVLGVGTFVVVVFGLAAAGPSTPSGESSGSVAFLRALVHYGFM